MGLFSKKKKIEETRKIFELEGIKIGSVFRGKKKIKTSLGGIDGILQVSITYGINDVEDNVVWKLTWEPVDTITDNQLLTVKNVLENKFDIVFNWSETNYVDIDDYMISINVKKARDFENAIYVTIFDMMLSKKVFDSEHIDDANF